MLTLSFASSCALTQETFYVIYDANSADSGYPPTDGMGYESGESITVLGNTGDLKKYANSFGGWNTKADGSGVTYSSGQSLFMGKSDMILYATWIPDTKFTVTYHSNTADSGRPPVDEVEYLAGESVTVLGNLYELEKEGYIFRGWNTESDYSGVLYLPGEEFEMPADYETLHAMWVTPHTVTYSGNEASLGNIPTDENEYLVKDSVIISDNSGSLSKVGHTFIGWNSKADGTGIDYAINEIIEIPNYDLLLYANWSVNSYLVKFETNEGTLIESQEVKYNEKVLEPSNPTKDDYSFSGWFKDSEYTIRWDFTTDTVNKDMILYAKWDSIYPESFAGGTGTLEDPFQVATAGHLYIVRNHLDKHFIQTANIDLSIFNEKGWNPLGVWYGSGYVENLPFSGSYNGNGYKIMNLFINRSNENYIGLFRYVSKDALIDKVILDSVSIQGDEYIGGIAGYSQGVINHCQVSGNLTSEGSYIGGIVGYSLGDIMNSGFIGDINGGNAYTGGIVGRISGTITKCNSTGNISSDGRYLGGLAGLSYSDLFNSYANCNIESTSTTGDNIGGLIGEIEGSIINSSFEGSVIGASSVGGLAGRASSVEKSSAQAGIKGSGYYVGGLIGISSGSISESYFCGSVSGKGDVGGFIGRSLGAYSNCYAIADVTGEERVGGFIGYAVPHYDKIISSSFSSGEIIGNIGVGGFIGAKNDHTLIENCFYDSSITGLTSSEEFGIPKITSEMMQQETFNNWNFSTIWAIGENLSYPYLRWEVE